MYLLRTTPPSATGKETSHFDELMHEGLAAILVIPLPPEIFREFQLSVRPIDDTHPIFGSELLSTVDVAPAVFLDSISLTHGIGNRINNKTAKQAISEYWFGDQAYLLFKQRSMPN